MTANTYKVGKALDNDIVLLESSALANIATLQKAENTYVWKEPFRQIDLQKSGFDTHGYHFRIRDRRWVFQIFVFVFCVLIVLTLLQWFVQKPKTLTANTPKVQTETTIKTSEELYMESEKLFHDRHIRKGNLVRSIHLLEQAKQNYEAKALPTPKSVNDLLESALLEKKKFIQDHRAMAQKFSQQGDSKKSRKIYEKLLDELIDRSDPDRLRIENEMRQVK